MADKNIDKEALKAQKEAEKAAEKAKKERIKASKPKKEGTVFSRGTAAVKKFCKDFVGTCKKVAWPTGKQVIKNSGIVLATIAVIAVAVFGVDWALTEVFDLAKQGAVSLGEQFAIEETTEEETTAETTTAGESTTASSEETTEEGETSEETSAEETTGEEAASEETTVAE
ncbi:MAG: preprotein translocase subunit SecE [Clostridia bacterium]|nr:preprotein translocase subunit SecE [Clostridia bacterium]